MAPQVDKFADLKALLESSVKSLKDLITSNRDELMAKLEEVNMLKTELAEEKKVTSHLSKEIFTLKTKMNDFEQQAKSNSIRVFGINIPKEEEEAVGINKAVIKRVYDRVIKPILVVARSKNLIDTVPQINNCIAEGYRVGHQPRAGKSGPPPPCIIKFLSKDIRDIVLRLKKDNTPPPSQEEKSIGVKRVILVEDLTPATHFKLKELVEHKEFEKVWTINGQIRFTLTNDADKLVNRVSSPFLTTTELLNK